MTAQNKNELRMLGDLGINLGFYVEYLQSTEYKVSVDLKKLFRRLRKEPEEIIPEFDNPLTDADLDAIISMMTTDKNYLFKIASTYRNLLLNFAKDAKGKVKAFSLRGYQGNQGLMTSEDYFHFYQQAPIDPNEYIHEGTIWRGPLDGDGLKGEEKNHNKLFNKLFIKKGEINLVQLHDPNERFVSGNELFKRIKKIEGTPLDARFLRMFWESQLLIPEEWWGIDAKIDANIIVFAGTIIRCAQRSCPLILYLSLSQKDGKVQLHSMDINDFDHWGHFDKVLIRAAIYCPEK